MRKNLTPQEACLWSHLKAARGDGVHWRRQKPLLGYYLDFVTLGHRLIVEVDGSHHQIDDRQAEHDMIRDKVFARCGFMTLRFTNLEIDENIGWVLETISDALVSRGPTLTATRSCPPDKREGLDNQQ